MNLGQSANKKTLLGELLDLGMVLVALDARCEGVDVPAHLSADPQLRLNLSYRFGLPMAIDPWGISATLTFSGVPHACRFPWRSVFLMVSHINGEPYLFPTDVPEELMQHGGADGTWSLRDTVLPNTSPRPRLTVVAQPASDEAPTEAAPRPRKRSRRASGPAFSHATRRAAWEREQNEGTKEAPPTDPGNALVPPATPDTTGSKRSRSRHHLRVVK